MSCKSTSAEERLVQLSETKARLLELLLKEKSRQGDQSSRILPYPRDAARAAGGLPLSAAQQRLWFLEQLEGGRTAYHIPLALNLHGNLNLQALRTALNAMIVRHESLRTIFRQLNGEPRQIIRADGVFELRVLDLSELDTQRREKEIRYHQTAEAYTKFELAEDSLIRAYLLRVTSDRHVLLITMHHIISDGWSMGIFSRELSELYSAFLENREPLLAPLPIQYADYAQWHRQWLQDGVSEKQLGYWRQRLQGVSAHLELPTDRPRPAVPSYRGENVSVTFDAALSKMLKNFAQRNEMTLFMVLCAGWATLLARLSGQEDVVIGIPVANRPRPELEGLIGFFVNTLPLRIAARPDSTALELMREVKDATLEAYDNQDVPFEQLVEAVQPERSSSRNPLFQVMLAVQNVPQGGLQLAGLATAAQPRLDEPAKFDLLLALGESGDQIVGILNFATDLFERTTVERWLQSLQVILRGMLEDASARIAELPILSPDEQRQVVETFNSTHANYPQDQLVHELVEVHALHTPDAVAVVCADRVLSYAQLNERANQVAHLLLQHGVQPDDRVGLFVDRSVDMIISLLGILKAGGCYVPLDIRYPTERLRHMVYDSGLVVLLTEERFKAALPQTSARIVALDSDAADIEDCPRHNPDLAGARLHARHLAYVIYTSGSTGTPKGVLVEHRNLLNLVQWHCAAFDLRQGCCSSCVAAVGFDAATWEIWPPLAVGATLALAPSDVIADAERFLAWWAAQPLDVSFLPTPLAELAFSRNISNPTLRTLLVGGDRLSQQPGTRSFALINNYGPTECTVVATSGAVGEHDALLHIGRPIANSQIYILDARRQPVPIGVAGELYIAGAGVARGYLNRPELEAERFVADPFSSGAHARMYRSGDLARWRADGTVEFLGRNDEQVKIRGYRIELGEIEAQLARHERLREVAVVARNDGSGEKRLVVYFTVGEHSEVGADELRAYMRALVPEYMVPSAFVRMDCLPFTAHGKLDRLALPAPQIDAYASEEYEPPQGDVEGKIAAIWQEFLGVPRVGRQDNFFELGGHSLLAVKALFEINEAVGSALKVAEVYQSPTLEALAARIGGAASNDALVDLSREAMLDDDIVAIEALLPTVPASSVLLTGATGFVGRFLLVQLLRDTDATIHCLVRAKSPAEARLRLRSTLVKWDLWRDEYSDRTVAIAGDLRRPRLGVDAATYDMLCSNVDSVFHCATSMNHLETYEMAKPVNVAASQDLLRLATRTKSKLINYISTLSIYETSTDPTRVVNEDTPIEYERHRASQGYVASKWVGEKLFMNAVARGIPCNIFRLGLVWADSEQGRFDELQNVHRILKSSLLSGYGIQGYRYAMAPTPVDYAVRAMVLLAKRHPYGRGIFHISSTRQTVPGVFECCNEVAGTSLQLIPHYHWIEEVKRLHAQGRSLPALPIVQYAFALDSESFQRQVRDARSAELRFDCSRTHRELDDFGIVAPVFDEGLLRTGVEGMRSWDQELREAADLCGGVSPEFHSGTSVCAPDLRR